MNNTQKALINQDVCEQTTPNLGITQSSGLDDLDAQPLERRGRGRLRALPAPLFSPKPRRETNVFYSSPVESAGLVRYT